MARFNLSSQCSFAGTIATQIWQHDRALGLLMGCQGQVLVAHGAKGCALHVQVDHAQGVHSEGLCG
jgi:hypothetical protein